MYPDTLAKQKFVFEVLKKHGVPFVIIGGHAVHYHGYPRLTENCDVVWLRNGNSESVLLAALTELGANYIGKEIDPVTNIERIHPVTPGYIEVHHLMMLFTNYGFLDLFDYIPGHPLINVYEIFESAIEADGLKFPSRRWLVKMKETSHRLKDRADLEGLPPEV